MTNSARNGLPPQLARLPRDAVQPIRLDRARLMAMAFGDELALNLPEGERTLVHDNRYTHEKRRRGTGSVISLTTARPIAR